jgi:hypothetical protein
MGRHLSNALKASLAPIQTQNPKSSKLSFNNYAEDLSVLTTLE